MTTTILAQLAAAIEVADSHRRLAGEALRGRRAILPLRYWRQQAHFTTPAADGAMARKAIESGTESMARILQRLGLGAADLAERLGIDPGLVEGLLERPRRAPLVMLDGEDAQALRDDVAADGLRNAAELFAGADWSGNEPATLRFFRPPGFNLESSVRDLYTLLWTLADHHVGRNPSHDRSAADIPLDGIVFPKIEHPEEVDLLYMLLDEAETALGLRQGLLRVGLLVESGWAIAQLPEIATRAAPRLCALIFGIADYSADLGLPAIENDHPLADWARAEIVAVSGAVGVPAIDGMTLAYPVAGSSLSAAQNRRQFLDRMAVVYRDTVRAREFGMLGKWVGHPAQLFAVLLAYDEGLRADLLESEAAKLEAYETSVTKEARGATIIAGNMSDRATDRHARVILRQATAMGRFDPDRAAALGVIGVDEIAEARGLWLGSTLGG